MTEMKTLTIGGTTYEVVDDAARSGLEGKQSKITGTAGQFVVIGDDGNVTTQTISNAEEVGF